jgi:hypothetical protein
MAARTAKFLLSDPVPMTVRIAEVNYRLGASLERKADQPSAA